MNGNILILRGKKENGIYRAFTENSPEIAQLPLTRDGDVLDKLIKGNVYFLSTKGEAANLRIRKAIKENGHYFIWVHMDSNTGIEEYVRSFGLTQQERLKINNILGT